MFPKYEIIQMRSMVIEEAHHGYQEDYSPHLRNSQDDTKNLFVDKSHGTYVHDVTPVEMLYGTDISPDRPNKWLSMFKSSRRRPTLLKSIPTQEEQTSKDRMHYWDLHGWRMGVFLGCCLSAFVLVFNFALILIAAGAGGGDDFGKGNIGTLMIGKESTVARWNTVCHLAVNVLSTGLLSASNYTMQVLNSPTRDELDRTHANGKWLEVGLLSLRNIRIMPRQRLALCLVLATSSIPLHLFYNASIFKISVVDAPANSNENSRIQISLVFMSIVIASNLIKLSVMLIVLISDDSEYIVTLGDAAASYLEWPDVQTEGRSLLYKDQILISMASPRALEPERQVWKPRSRRYCSSLSRDKAWSTGITGLCLVIVLIVLVARANYTDNNIWQWGTASSGTLSFGSAESTTSGILWNSWLCNMPQLFLSLFYLNVNTICTFMAGMAEWNNLGAFAKGLRVTEPSGEQRSTYFLQLPYRWSVPLILASIILHWTLSQSFFPIRGRYFNGTNPDGSIRWIDKSASGVSVLSFVAFCAALLVVGTAVLSIGVRHFKARLPPAENCSLVISAACHPAPDEVDPHLAKVQWGFLPGYERYSLSARHVEGPEVREM